MLGTHHHLPRRRAALLLALALGLMACARPAPPPRTAPTEPPLLSLRLLDGTPVELRAYRGRVVLLDIWATWCKPCLVSLPFYSELYRSLEAKGVTVLAVSVDESASAVRDFLDAHPVPFPTLHDPRAEVPRALGATAMPTLFLLDRSGKIRWKHDGFQRGDEALVRAQVTGLVAAPGE